MVFILGLIVDIRKKLPGFTLNIEINTDEGVMGLLGASGSGKSMTLRCIAGIDKPDLGRIVLNDRILFDAEKGINIPSRYRKVGYLFQNYALFPHMTVKENIEFGLGKLAKAEKKAVLESKLEMMKLQGMEDRYSSQLSGGQQQRVALARALAVEPEILLLDEPFSALDDHLRSIMTKQLIDTLADFNGNTLFVTHNMEEAYRICEKLAVLRNGEVEAYGGREEVFQKPPTLLTAQLTGCKNFSAAEYLTGGSLYAPDWGVELQVRQSVEKSLRHVGIRAHYIKLARDINDLSDYDGKNVFDCWPGFISEAPFRVTVYLSIGSKSAGSEGYHLQWEISKEKWLELREQPLPWKIYLDPEKLMVFEK